MYQIIIIGGGMAGLFSAIQLARAGLRCLVIEKKSYPFHRVCGEYISNEAEPFLRSLNLFPEAFNPPVIKNFLLSSIKGHYGTLPLTLGGFGISRYTYDAFLYEQARLSGVAFLLDTEVLNVDFSGQSFLVKTSASQFHAEIVIGAFGKRSKLDINLKRHFVQLRSPYVGVKYHAYSNHPADVVALHNFRGGYCGVSNVEDGKTNICYLTHRDNLRRYKNVQDMEEAILFENPLLRSVFKDSQFILKKPEIINEISFAPKTPLEGHMLMVGDSAGMITPLCGNGMAIAIHSSKIISELVVQFFNKDIARDQLEATYCDRWSDLFSKRLWAGRQVQQLFGSSLASAIAINLAIHVKPLARFIVRNTHGKVF